MHMDILYFPFSVFLYKCSIHETRKMNKYVNYIIIIIIVHSQKSVLWHPLWFAALRAPEVRAMRLQCDTWLQCTVVDSVLHLKVWYYSEQCHLSTTLQLNISHHQFWEHEQCFPREVRMCYWYLPLGVYQEILSQGKYFPIRSLGAGSKLYNMISDDISFNIIHDPCFQKCEVPTMWRILTVLKPILPW